MNIEAIKNATTRFIADEDGATAIEYALIAALIAVGIIIAARALGVSISGTFDDIKEELDGA